MYFLNTLPTYLSLVSPGIVPVFTTSTRLHRVYLRFHHFTPHSQGVFSKHSSHIPQSGVAIKRYPRHNIIWYTNHNLIKTRSTHSFVCSPVFRVYIYQFSIPSIHSFNHLTIHPSIHSFNHLTIHPSIHSPVDPLTYAWIHPSIHLLIHYPCERIFCFSSLL